MRQLITYLFGLVSILMFSFGIVFGPPFPVLTIAFGMVFIISNIIFDKKRFYYPCLLGASLNLAAVATNGLQMPVANPLFNMDAAHTTMTATTHLKFLCDIIPLGHWGVISVGDIFICGGTLLTLAVVLVYKYVRERNEKSKHRIGDTHCGGRDCTAQ